MRERFHPSELLSGKGSIEVITGPMFSGKTGELIRRLRRAKIAVDSMQKGGILKQVDLHQRIMVFKPAIDTRRGHDTVNTEDGAAFPATPLNKPSEALDLINQDTLIVAFDEAQFWPEADLVTTVRALAKNKGIKTMVAGLSLSFNGEKWGGVGTLAMEADTSDIFSAICTKCGDEAQYTQRKIEETDASGKKIVRPANWGDPIEIVGSTNLYEARCRQHHEVPGRPVNN